MDSGCLYNKNWRNVGKKQAQIQNTDKSMVCRLQFFEFNKFGKERDSRIYTQRFFDFLNSTISSTLFPRGKDYINKDDFSAQGTA